MASRIVAALVRPVVKALAKAGLSQKELLAGPIEHTELMWQTPPLLAEAPLDGVPLHVYFDMRPPTVRVEQFYNFWCNTLQFLRSAPYKVADETGYRQMSFILPSLGMGERLYYLTPPDGFPAAISDYAAVTLSLECANLLRNAAPIVEVCESDDNYYVITAEGFEVGVRGGLPIVGSEQWDLPVNGLVRDLLRMSRGEVFVGCDYDLIAKLRSALHSLKGRVPEFEGCDLALQALRVIAHGKQLSEIQMQVKSLQAEMKRDQRRLKALREAIELSEVFTISDRARVMAIRALLVPEFMKITTFQKTIYASDHIPASVTPKAIQKIQQGLQLLLAEEERNAR